LQPAVTALSRSSDRSSITSSVAINEPRSRPDEPGSTTDDVPDGA
jgi:hypothetical protein